MCRTRLRALIAVICECENGRNCIGQHLAALSSRGVDEMGSLLDLFEHSGHVLHVLFEVGVGVNYVPVGHGYISQEDAKEEGAVLALTAPHRKQSQIWAAPIAQALVPASSANVFILRALGRMHDIIDPVKNVLCGVEHAANLVPAELDTEQHCST